MILQVFLVILFCTKFISDTYITGTEFSDFEVMRIILAISYFVIGLSILSYGFSIYLLERLWCLSSLKESDDDDLLLRKDEDELEDEDEDEYLLMKMKLMKMINSYSKRV